MTANFEQVVIFVNAVVLQATGRYLSDLEVDLLKGAWNDLTYEQIAETCGYSLNYLQRDLGPKFWKLLSDAFGQKLNKANLRSFLIHQIEQGKLSQPAPAPTQTIEPSATPIPLKSGSASITQASADLLSPVRIDWGEAIDVSTFYGRTEELDLLTEWVARDRCRLVTLLGMGGVGKSSLAAKIAHQLQDQFKFVIWRSLRNAPPFETLLANLVPFLSDERDTQTTPERLLYWLRTHRCLIILDNLETIMQAGDRAGRYQPDYEDYGELIQLIGESAHQSCLILTTREKPAEVSMMEGLDAWVRSLPLGGSPEVSLSLINTKGLVGDEQVKQLLCDRYNYMPLALKIVASSIHSLFDGDISLFLEQETLLFNGLRRLLEQQFERLSWLEQTVMYWLAINREWTTISELQDDMLPKVTRVNLLEALESLAWRSLIEKRSGQYTQQSVVMEYVTDDITQKIAMELLTQKPSLFTRFALIKTTSKDYIRESQTRLILQSIAAKLLTALGTSTDLEQVLKKMLSLLQRLDSQVSYGAGNLLNLCCHLPIDLTHYDFSNLGIHHAYLGNSTLHNVNFTNASFYKSVFTQNFGTVLSVAFSPDGRSLVTGLNNGKINQWQIEDEQQVMTYERHADWVWAVAYSADGRLLASGSEDQTIKLWDIATGQLLKTLGGFPTWILSIAFSPATPALASGHSDSIVRLWDIHTGAVIHSLVGHEDAIGHVAFSLDGTLLASSSADHTVKLWDATSGRLLKTLVGHADTVYPVVFDPTGRSVISAGKDHTIRLWDVQTGQLLQTLSGHVDTVRTLALMPYIHTDGHEQTLLASGGDDRTIRIWDLQRGQILRTLQGHTHRVWSVTFRPVQSGSSVKHPYLLASGSDDQTFRLWDVQTGQLLRAFQGYENQIGTIAISPDGRWIASSGNEELIRLWDVQSGRCTNVLKGHTDPVWSIAFSPTDADCLVSASEDTTVRIWSIQTGQCLQVLKGHLDWVWSVAVSPDGKLLASAGNDRTIRLWNLQTGELIGVLQTHQQVGLALTFNPSKTLLICGGNDGHICVWDIATQTLTKTLSKAANWIRNVTFSPDGITLASASTDRTIQLWDIETGTLLHILKGHENAVWSVAFSLDGKTLISGSADNTLRLWQVDTGECVMTLQGHTNTVRSVVWQSVQTEQGPTDAIASGSFDGSIRLWNPATGECWKTLKTNRPYEGMRITGISGITDAQKQTLKTLGAIE